MVDRNGSTVGRRTFLKAAGFVAGATALGVTGRASAAEGFDEEFVNVRVREAQKLWRRGYRGRPDRTIGATDTGVDARHPDVGPWNEVAVEFGTDKDEEPSTDPRTVDYTSGETGVNPFADVPKDPTAVTPDTPKLLGFYDANARYGDFGTNPQDTNGHGTHVSSIQAGTGRASDIDANHVEEHAPYAILTAGGTLQYEVEAAAGTGVFGSAFGAFIEMAIEGPDGRELDRTTFQEGDATRHDDSSYDGSNVVTEAATVHEEGTATYTVIVRAMDGEFTSTARVERVAVGPFSDHDETVGDRLANATPSLHTGIAPNESIVMFSGLSDPTADLGGNAEWFADTFNLRSINMSWGYRGGAPVGAFGGRVSEALFGSNTVEAVSQMAEGGILTVAAAGNSATPANGNSAPAVADEAVSVAATGPLDGLVAYSSGGLGGFDEDENDVDPKPDVTAPGGSVTDLANAARSSGKPYFKDGASPHPPDEPPRDYVEKAGTSMASPYANGTVAVLAEALEFDAPETIALPEPSETTWADLRRLKSVLLATASETAYTAAPYHKAHAPTYDFGGRDPYEGFGRINPDAAVDAVTRGLSGTISETVGLNVPEHSRAVAGVVGASGEPATYDISLEVSHLSGGNRGMAKGDPHLDLFVYDLENPGENGEPTVAAKAQGMDGSASLSFSAVEQEDDGTIREGTYAVVAKLVNVPGVVNGYHVGVHFDLSVDRTERVVALGSRTDDGSAFTGGQTDDIHIEVRADDPVIVRDRVPREWDVLEEYSDDVAEVVPDGQQVLVYFDLDGDGVTDADDLAEAASYRYLVEAPEGADHTGTYEFGPVEVSTDPDAGNRDDSWVAVPGTSDTNVVVGPST